MTTRVSLARRAYSHVVRHFSTGPAVTTAMVKELRALTSAPVLECKNALKDETVNGDIQLAVEWLRKRGVTLAAKKQDRVANEGLVGILANKLPGSHLNQSITFCELKSETDFVARNSSFQDLLKKILEIGSNTPQVSEEITQLSATVGEKLELGKLLRIENKGNQVLGSYLHGKFDDFCGTRAASVVIDVDKKIPDDALLQVQEFADKLSLQLIGGGALFIENISEEYIEKEKEIEIEAAKASEEEISEKKIEKKVAKKLKSLEKEIILMQQSLVTGEGIVSRLLKNLESAVKANLKISSAVRFEVGGENARLP